MLGGTEQNRTGTMHGPEAMLFLSAVETPLLRGREGMWMPAKPSPMAPRTDTWRQWHRSLCQHDTHVNGTALQAPMHREGSQHARVAHHTGWVGGRGSLEGGGGGHKALVVGSVSLWRRLLASRL